MIEHDDPCAADRQTDTGQRNGCIPSRACAHRVTSPDRYCSIMLEHYKALCYAIQQ